MNSSANLPANPFINFSFTRRCCSSWALSRLQEAKTSSMRCAVIYCSIAVKVQKEFNCSFMSVLLSMNRIIENSYKNSFLRLYSICGKGGIN